MDYVLLCVKHFQLDEAIPKLAPLLGPESVVVPLQNGIDAHEHLIRPLGRERVVGGLASIVSMIEAPAVIRQEGRLQRVVIGELDGRLIDRVAAIVNALAGCGLRAIHSQDILADLWCKFLFIAPFALVSSLGRASAGEIAACTETRDLLLQAMEEAAALGHRRRISLPATAVQDAMAVFEGLEPTATSSMQRDVASGRPFEPQAFGGTIVRLERELEIPTPVHAAGYALLRPALDRALAASCPPGPH